MEWSFKHTYKAISAFCLKLPLVSVFTFEPKHDKTNDLCAQRRLRSAQSDHICTVWSETSLCTQWAAKDPSFLYVDRVDARAELSFANRTGHFVGFVMLWLIWEQWRLQRDCTNAQLCTCAVCFLKTLFAWVILKRHKILHEKYQKWSEQKELYFCNGNP